VSILVDIQIKEVSQADAIFYWNRDNPDDKYSRNAPNWYNLENWIVRSVDGEVVGIAGYTDKGEYAIFGGMKARSKNKPKGGGNWKALLDARKEKFVGVPKIVGLKSSKVPQATWVSMNRRAGFQNEDMMNVPEEMVNNFKSRYGDDWGIMKQVSWFYPFMRGAF